MMEEPRKFITMGKHVAVEIGDWEKTQESFPLVKPTSTADFFQAVVREGSDELTLRSEEKGMLCTFIDTEIVVNSGWWPPLVDED